MKKICLSDSDADFFADELHPSEFDYFQKHKEAFKCMWIEQGKPFWTKFIITFRSYTSRHGIVKDMPYESEKLKDIMDFAFIVVHDNFIDGSASAAQNFTIDIARLAQNKDKLPNLDSKKFAKDPFYRSETRDIFRMFFGPPTEKVSYIKVYILFPVYLRLCGSICRCLLRWMEAEKQDPEDLSYWTPPEPLPDKKTEAPDDPVYLNRVLMCETCIETCGLLYMQEMECGSPTGPQFLSLWKHGNPRLEVEDNPLYVQSFRGSDWRDGLNIDEFRDFNYFLNVRYADVKCPDCEEIRANKERIFALGEGRVVRKGRRGKRSKERGHGGGREVFVGRVTSTDPGAAHRKYMHGFDASNPNVDKELVADNMPSGRRTLFGEGMRVKEIRQDNLTPTVDCGVVKIINDKNRWKETTIYAVSKHSEPTSKKKISELKTDKSNIYSPYLTGNLPQGFEWAEGRGWCVGVFNYEDEERRKYGNFTNFALKVAGNNKANVIDVFDSLVKYVVSRKNRSPCAGWTLDEHDVLNSVMGKKSFKAMTVIIMDGKRYRDYLTDWEKRTESKLEVKDEEIRDIITSVHKKFIRKPNLLVEEPTVSREIGEGWKQYYDIVKRVRDRCDFPRESRHAIGKRCLVDIDITQGKIDFSISDKERYPDSYYPDLEQLDIMYLRAWLKLEKLGVQTNGSAVDLYTLIQQKQKAALREAERDKAKHGKCEDPNCANNKWSKSTCQHRNIKVEVMDCKKKGCKCHTSGKEKDCREVETKAVEKRPDERESVEKNLVMIKKDLMTKKNPLDLRLDDKDALEKSVRSTIAGMHELSNSLTLLEKEISKSDVTIKINRKQLKPMSQDEASKKVEGKIDASIQTDDNDIQAKQADKKDLQNKSLNSDENKTLSNKRLSHSEKEKEESDEDADEEEEDEDDTTSKVEYIKKTRNVTLRICYFCKSTEPVFRTYKKCQRCQQEKITECRYYCGRLCQSKDWEEKHRKEHLENLLK